MRVGYCRVSTAEQNTARQEVLLESLAVDRVFLDKCSGKNTDIMMHLLYWLSIQRSIIVIPLDFKSQGVILYGKVLFRETGYDKGGTR